ncbi:MAG: dienelactone hydrolase family protein [Pseudomonadota bacterium]
MKPEDIDPQVYALYDEYCHSEMPRREFMQRASMIVVAGGSALAMAEALVPQYAKAQTISFTDKRIKPTYVTYPSPGGNADEIRGYLVEPEGDGPFPAVLIVHENRGLNPYIEDVARRAAVAGFLALAPDALSPLGGYPGNDDDGKVMQRKLDRQKIFTDMLNGAKFVKAHEKSTGKLGATGFCFGGRVTNFLAVEMGGDLSAAAPFYGTAPDIAKVGNIGAKVVVHYAEDDPRVNATRADYEAALKSNNVDFEMHTYPGTNHGFHNNSTLRYNKDAATLAWDRTIKLFKDTLA